MRRLTDRYGTEWVYIPNRSRTAIIHGVRVTIRKLGTAAKGKFWRLSVAGNLAMGNQFHATIGQAMKVGRELAEKISKEGAKAK